MRLDIIPVLSPNSAGNHDTTASLAATTSTSAISIGVRNLAMLSVNGTFHLRRGTSTIDAAGANDLQLPAGVYMLDSGVSYTDIRIYNPGASAINYWIADCSNS